MTETARVTDGAGPMARPPARHAEVRRVVAVARWRRVLPLAAAAGDLAAVMLATTLALRLRYGGSVPALRIGDDWSVGYTVAGSAGTALWLAVVALHGGYRRAVVGTGPSELRRIARAGLTFFALLAAFHLLLRSSLSARLAVLVVVLTVLLTLAVRFLIERVVFHARAQHRWVQRAVLLGPERDTGVLADRLRSTPALGVEVVGACLTDDRVDVRVGGQRDGNGHRDVQGRDVGVGDPDGAGGLDGSIGAGRFRGEGAAVLGMMSAAGADVLAVTGGTSAERVRALAWELEPAGIDLLVAPPVVDLTTPRLAVDSLAGIPLLRVEPCRLTAWRLAGKNLFDRIGAAVLLVVLSPVFAACALAVRMTSQGPVFYRQPRVGWHGTLFEFVKFRTMVAGAEARTQELAHRNETDGLLFKIRDDPRVTTVGRVLRRTSLDELPQLWNVLRGDMSLVGPRPLPVPPSAFVGDARRRLRVKPGITGLWQVSGRSELSWDETVRIDAQYVDNWSLGLDLLILLRTPLAIVRGRGAY
jgi:lipopolysaccharide/colanic/teichoic acid biosynthesis glycosyltransferase